MVVFDKMRKKAIAPLVSTIVLILFAAGLGIIVMNWGSTATYAIKTIQECEKSSLNIIEINEKKSACFEGNKFYFTAENNGEATIDSLKISFIGDDVYQVNLYEKYFVGNIKKNNVEYEDIGPILKVKIAPLVGGEICAKQSTSIENIQAC